MLCFVKPPLPTWLVMPVMAFPLLASVVLMTMSDVMTRSETAFGVLWPLLLFGIGVRACRRWREQSESLEEYEQRRLERIARRGGSPA
jgi:hypothetical protein